MLHRKLSAFGVQDMTNIAFIGLGNMGGPMAANLAKARHRVLGYDLVPELCDAAEKTGVIIADSIAQAVELADVILTMLPSGRHVLEVWREIALCARQSTMIIDCSTIDVASAKAAHAIALEAGLIALDAPVSGGTGGAKAGTLTFMCGGHRAGFSVARPTLEHMGKRIILCGDEGAGQAAKICNNMILGATMIATCEAFVLAEKLGLDHQALFEVASTSSGNSWSMSTYCPVPGPVPTSPANNAYKPGFAAALMLKDLKLAQEAASASGANTPLGSHAAQLYARFVEDGNGGQDFSGIVEWLRGQAAS